MDLNNGVLTISNEKQSSTDNGGRNTSGARSCCPQRTIEMEDGSILKA